MQVRNEQSNIQQTIEKKSLTVSSHCVSTESLSQMLQNNEKAISSSQEPNWQVFQDEKRADTSSQEPNWQVFQDEKRTDTSSQEPNWQVFQDEKRTDTSSQEPNWQVFQDEKRTDTPFIPIKKFPFVDPEEDEGAIEFGLTGLLAKPSAESFSQETRTAEQTQRYQQRLEILSQMHFDDCYMNFFALKVERKRQPVILGNQATRAQTLSVIAAFYQALVLAKGEYLASNLSLPLATALFVERCSQAIDTVDRCFGSQPSRVRYGSIFCQPDRSHVTKRFEFRQSLGQLQGLVDKEQKVFPL